MGAAPILVVGSVALDAVYTPTETATEILGGAASYFCLSAALFAPVRLVAVVGEDFPTEHKALLQSRNIDLAGLQVRPGKTFRWTARYSGGRLENRETLDTQLNVFAGFHPTLPEAYRDSTVVFLANIQPELQLEVLEQVPDARFIACDTMKLWLDTARPGLERLLRRVDCVLMNDEEAEQFSGQRFLPAAARVILSYGPSAVIIKRGENGSSSRRPIRWKRCAIPRVRVMPSRAACWAPWREPETTGKTSCGTACCTAAFSVRSRSKTSACAVSCKPTRARSKGG
jgi:sugar/nucleoside kinase (ribokinase family)